ncbi:putative aldehyde reductase [Aspergillus crustosus]
MPEYAIDPGSVILVTGANGYIASHIINILLQRDCKGEDSLESVVVPQLDASGACDEVIKGVSGIVHVAADVSSNLDPEVVISWVKHATLNLLEAAKTENTMKRFVLTSSSSATVSPVPNIPMQIDQDIWNELSPRAAWSQITPPAQRRVQVYAVSKVEQERDAWRWVRESSPGFRFNTVLPNMTPLLPEIPGSTMQYVRDILKGNDSAVYTYPSQWFIDVQDAARLHVVALLDTRVKSERIFGFASVELRPHNKLIPDPPEKEGYDLSTVINSCRDRLLLREFFGQDSWTTLEKSIEDGIEGFD